MQELLQGRALRPEADVPCELMFDQKRNLFTRLADAADLLLDFATLGEYGLEPAPERCRAQVECRPGRSRSASAHRPTVWVSVR